MTATAIDAQATENQRRDAGSVELRRTGSLEAALAVNYTVHYSTAERRVDYVHPGKDTPSGFAAWTSTVTIPASAAYLGQWETPFWVGDENRGTLRRIGFSGAGRINRHDFGVSWQDNIPGGGVVVSNHVEARLDVEAILDEDLERTGAIEYYR